MSDEWAEDRYWILDVPTELDTSGDNRIHEVTKAAEYNCVGLVDEQCGGVIGYLHAALADDIVDTLNRGEAS